jgi:hypothetical protein
MRRLIPALIAAAALAAPATASASGLHATPCRTTQPGFVHYLGEIATNCTTARAVERYWVGHEIPTRTVRIAGIRWTYRGASWWGDATETSFLAGNRIVYISHRPSG